MLLTIDVGNTNTVFAVFSDDGVLQNFWRCATESSRSSDEYAVFLKQLLDLVNLNWNDISDVAVSSVVPDTNFHIGQFCRKYISAEPLFIDSKTVTGITVDLDNPQEIGADRLVNAVAVKAHYDLPAIVIDFGTATTFDVIDTGGIYRGGVIAPGVRLSMEALTSRAAKLPKINIENPGHVIGKNTLDAMQSGMYWGYIGMIDTIVERIKAECHSDMHVIATGGLAPMYAENAKSIDVVDEHLIFKGVLDVYKSHKK